LGFESYSQVGLGTATPDNSSALDVRSLNSGILVPRMTQIQRNLITSPALSLLIYQTDNSPSFYYFDGTIWTDFGAKNWSLLGIL